MRHIDTMTIRFRSYSHYRYESCAGGVVVMYMNVYRWFCSSTSIETDSSFEIQGRRPEQCAHGRSCPSKRMFNVVKTNRKLKNGMENRKEWNHMSLKLNPSSHNGLKLKWRSWININYDALITPPTCQARDFPCGEDTNADTETGRALMKLMVKKQTKTKKRNPIIQKVSNKGRQTKVQKAKAAKTQATKHTSVSDKLNKPGRLRLTQEPHGTVGQTRQQGVIN